MAEVQSDDDARSGGFEPLRFVPPGKFVVLGLVTTKRGELESKDRRGEAALWREAQPLDRHVSRGLLDPALQPVLGNALTREEQIAKLELIVETAAEVWG
jgi:5-methyltetrahydropteroyltriglutamate--homocysteine methyltransferase